MIKNIFTRKTIKFNIPIIVEPDGDRFYAYTPSLKGVHVDGNTEQVVITNSRKACMLYLNSMIKHNEPIPFVSEVSFADHLSFKARQHIIQVRVNL